MARNAAMTNAVEAAEHANVAKPAMPTSAFFMPATTRNAATIAVVEAAEYARMERTVSPTNAPAIQTCFAEYHVAQTTLTPASPPTPAAIQLLNASEKSVETTVAAVPAEHVIAVKPAITGLAFSMPAKARNADRMVAQVHAAPAQTMNPASKVRAISPEAWLRSRERLLLWAVMTVWIRIANLMHTPITQ
jgi:hypothetical protein